MRGYDGPQDDYLDEYEEENEDQEEGDEYEEEEVPQPTKEELEYLQLRQRLKESIRKRIKEESGSNRTSSQHEKSKVSNDNFGSFFGPSQPVIARRVIEESKSLLETRHLSLNRPDSFKSNTNFTNTSVPNASRLDNEQRIKTEKKSKTQIVRDARDYSFLLSDDAKLPVPKALPSQNATALNSSLKSSQASIKGRHSAGIGQEEKPGLNVQKCPKASLPKPLVGKPCIAHVDSKRKLDSNNSTRERPVQLKHLPSKASGLNIEKKVMQNTKKPVSTSVKNGMSNLQVSTLQAKIQQKKEFQESKKERVLPKQSSVSKDAVSKSQMNKPEKDIKRKAVRKFSDDEDEDEDSRAISMVRKMFGYNPKKFAAYEDEDDSDMEANFDDIMMEEENSARIARKEDAEELRKIEEEERRERMRKLEKKRRMAQR